MEKYHLLIEINKKLSSGEDISVPEKENAVAVFLKGICPEDREWIDKLRAPLGEFISAKEKGEAGKLLGIWGAMSDLSRSFLPWEDGFTKGLYLAGVECVDDAEAPEGWTKWVIPGYEYVYVECEGADTFPQVIKYLEENHLPLVGAVHDFTCPETGKNYMFFPIGK